MRGVTALLSSPLFSLSYASFAFVAVFTIASSATAITFDEFNGSSSVAANQSTLTSFVSSGGSGIIGGSRKTKVSWLSGANSSSVDVDATVVSQNGEGTFLYSQDTTVAGQCILTWDGSQLANPTNALHPGGINLLQDNGTAFSIEVLSNDLPTDLELTVIDATDSSKTSKATVNLPAGGARVVTVPFNTLTGNASLTTVGGISLLVNKNATQALDLALGYIGTNGQCRLVPDANGRVIDECGVCGGDNSSCADCAGVPNGSAMVDQCGVCGGNGTSCLDCNGVVNGTAQLDRCGVCNGDGNSCLQCSQSDVTLLLATLDATAKSQEALIKNIYRQVERSTKSRSIKRSLVALRRQANALQIRNWTVSWTIPRISTTCANTVFCTSVSNRRYIEEYRKNSLSLRQMTVDALKLWQRVNPRARVHVPRYLRESNKIHAENEKLLTQVPPTQSSCTA